MKGKVHAGKKKTVRDGIACETQAKTVQERGERGWAEKAGEDRKAGKTRWMGRAWVRGKGEREGGEKGRRKMRGKARERGNVRKGQQ